MEHIQTTLLPNTTKSSNFTTSAIDVSRHLGASVGVNISNSSDISCQVYIMVAQDPYDPVYVELPKSRVRASVNENLLYNLGQMFYCKFKIMVDIISGSADFEIKVTTKEG